MYGNNLSINFIASINSTTSDCVDLLRFKKCPKIDYQTSKENIQGN